MLDGAAWFGFMTAIAEATLAQKLAKLTKRIFDLAEAEMGKAELLYARAIDDRVTGRR